MSSDSELTNANQIHTDGGAAVAGRVNTTGGDFVGRDQTIHGDQVGRDKITGAGDIHIHHYPSTPPAAAATDDALAPGDPPYQGMAYYDVADADRFFGREALTAELIDHLRQQPLLAVVGASGSGKSSLVRAGVLPALQGKQPLSDGKPPPTGSARWAYHLITPTARPLESLAASLTRSSESVTATGTLIDDLRRDQRSLHLYARRLVSGEQRLLLLVDQFEELFTLCKERAERQAFVENLLYAVQPDGVVTLIVTLRADFYHHCADFPALRTALETQQRYIGAMTPDELRRAIEEPAHAAHWSFQPGLVEQLLHDVGDEPGALPLLSHALLETWQRRRGRTLTLAGYRAAGGVQGAIAKTADDVFNRFTDEQKSIARIIFLRLTELGEGVQDTRRRVRPAELKLAQANPDAVQQVLKTLADARLVTTDEDEVQVAHEVLIRHWATLRAWLDDDREGHRIQRRLTEAANQWVEFGKDPALLYRGVLLQQAQAWLQSTIDPPNQIEIEFLQASQAEVETEIKRATELAAEREANRQRELENQQQRTRIFRNAVLISSLLLLIALGLAEWGRRSSIIASNNEATAVAARATTVEDRTLLATRAVEARDAQSKAEQQAKIARSRQLAAQSISELGKNNYELAILLAIEAGQLSPTVESWQAIHEAIAHPWHARSVLYSYTQPILSPDGQKALMANRDGILYVLDLASGKEQVLLGNSKDIGTVAAWNSDNTKLLTLNDNVLNNHINVWGTVSGVKLFELEASPGHSFSYAIFNKAGSCILTGSTDGIVRIWDANSGKELLTLEDTEHGAWNFDEDKIVTSGTGYIRVWDARNGMELLKFQVPSMTTKDQVAWSADGSRIVTENNGYYVSGIARIWDAKNGKELMKFDGMYITKWTPDHSKVLTVSGDDNDDTQRIIHIWDTSSGKELLKIDDHTNLIMSAIWNTKGDKILSGSLDGTIRVWDAISGDELVRLEGHELGIVQAIWNVDETAILSMGEDATVRIWTTTTGKELVRIDDYYDPELSPDGSKLRAYNEYRTLHIWNIKNSEELARFGGIKEAKWSADGCKILLLGDDHVMRLFDTTNNTEIIRLNAVEQMRWSSDERTILVRNTDHTAHLWDIAMGKNLSAFEGVERIEWSPNESKLVIYGTGSVTDSSVLVWDIARNEELARFISVDDIEWSPDESKILAKHGNYTSMWKTLIWDVAGRRELGRFTYYDARELWNKEQTKLLVNSSFDKVKILDIVTGEELLTADGHNIIGWSADDSKILTHRTRGALRILDSHTGKEVANLGEFDAVQGPVQLSKDRSKLFTSHYGEVVRIWNVDTGKELLRFEEADSFNVSNDESKILTSNTDNTISIWNSVTGAELTRFGNADWSDWSLNENKIIGGRSGSPIIAIWDANTGQEIGRIEEEVYSYQLNKDENKILTHSLIGAIGVDTVTRIWHLHQKDLLATACASAPRNFTWLEWGTYMEGNYHLTCPNAPIPPDVIEGIQDKARQQILSSQVVSATQRLEELNGWLRVNGQFKNYRVDVNAFTAEVIATATAEALPSPTFAPERTVTPMPPAR